jgi:hypothetical protein
VNVMDTKVPKILIEILDSKYLTQFTRPYYKRNIYINIQYLL